MNKIQTAFIVQSNSSIERWLHDVQSIEMTSSFNEADLIVFPGGLDVSPSLYNQPVGQHTSYSKAIDTTWKSIFEKGFKPDVRYLGICKGSQFLCAMAGGSLYQHVTNHAMFGRHSVIIKETQQSFDVTSTHHQMMQVSTLSEEYYDMLAYSAERRSTTYLNGMDEEDFPPVVEPEAVYFNQIRGLAIQFHPEFMEDDHPIQEIVRGWLNNIYPFPKKKEIKKIEEMIDISFKKEINLRYK